MTNNIDRELVSNKEIENLHRLMLYGRWIVVAILWVLIVPWGLWQLRETISLCQDYCTWSAIRLGLEFNPWAGLGLSFCVGLAVSVLVWQSSYILRGGLSDKQKYYLSQQVSKIRQQGKKNWLYHWVIDRK
ncbi:hypothetical protein [Geminocystis sp. NIES-3709]|uniref:hypothetical protein n=1 Tax=Geminocystis sp. NIES-3709 TaxID=1617448 RepID=UPI0005FCA10D|nr:hypothetical protein [Geminocystis sp. NIES-3709]BAQ66106.1 hypothetical protein GM3709_2871 [Geminocystis sp. NIES-3709]